MACQQNQILAAHSNGSYNPAMSSGRLVVVAELAVLTLHGDSQLPALYQTHFVTTGTSVRGQNNTVLLQCHTMDTAHATLALNGTLPWELECRGPVAHLLADLRGLQLRAFDLGIVRRGTILLAQPVGIAFLYMAGDVSDLTVQRPTGVTIRVQIGGSGRDLRLDEAYVAIALDGMDWQSRADRGTTARYEISIAGNVHNLTIATW